MQPLSEEQLAAIFKATGKLPPGYENTWRPLQWNAQETGQQQEKRPRGRPKKQPAPPRVSEQHAVLPTSLPTCVAPIGAASSNCSSGPPAFAALATALPTLPMAAPPPCPQPLHSGATDPFASLAATAAAALPTVRMDVDAPQLSAYGKAKHTPVRAAVEPAAKARRSPPRVLVGSLGSPPPLLRMPPPTPIWLLNVPYPVPLPPHPRAGQGALAYNGSLWSDPVDVAWRAQQTAWHAQQTTWHAMNRQRYEQAEAARADAIAQLALDAVELEVLQLLEERLDSFVIQMSHAYKGCLQNGRMVLVPRSPYNRFDGFIWHETKLPGWYEYAQQQLVGPRWRELEGYEHVQTYSPWEEEYRD
jgi:hypothetical protein